MALRGGIVLTVLLVALATVTVSAQVSYAPNHMHNHVDVDEFLQSKEMEELLDLLVESDPYSVGSDEGGLLDMNDLLLEDQDTDEDDEDADGDHEDHDLDSGASKSALLASQKENLPTETEEGGLDFDHDGDSGHHSPVMIQSNDPTSASAADHILLANGKGRRRARRRRNFRRRRGHVRRRRGHVRRRRRHVRRRRRNVRRRRRRNVRVRRRRRHVRRRRRNVRVRRRRRNVRRRRRFVLANGKGRRRRRRRRRPIPIRIKSSCNWFCKLQRKMKLKQARDAAARARRQQEAARRRREAAHRAHLARMRHLSAAARRRAEAAHRRAVARERARQARRNAHLARMRQLDARRNAQSAARRRALRAAAQRRAREAARRARARAARRAARHRRALALLRARQRQNAKIAARNAKLRELGDKVRLARSRADAARIRRLRLAREAAARARRRERRRREWARNHSSLLRMKANVAWARARRLRAAQRAANSRLAAALREKKRRAAAAARRAFSKFKRRAPCIKNDCSNPTKCINKYGFKKKRSEYPNAIHRGGKWYKNNDSNEYFTHCTWTLEKTHPHMLSPYLEKKAGRWVRKPYDKIKNIKLRDGKYYLNADSDTYWHNGQWIQGKPKKNCRNPTVYWRGGRWRNLDTPKTRSMFRHKGIFYRSIHMKYEYKNCKWVLSDHWIRKMRGKVLLARRKLRAQRLAQRLRRRRERREAQIARLAEFKRQTGTPKYQNKMLKDGKHKIAARRRNVNVLKDMVKRDAKAAFDGLTSDFMKKYFNGMGQGLNVEKPVDPGKPRKQVALGTASELEYDRNFDPEPRHYGLEHPDDAEVTVSSKPELVGMSDES